MTLRAISTTQALTEALREEILAGDLPPGTQLPEERVAARFGVARPTVHVHVP